MDPLVMTNITIEAMAIEIVDFPLKKMVIERKKLAMLYHYLLHENGDFPWFSDVFGMFTRGFLGPRP